MVKKRKATRPKKRHSQDALLQLARDVRKLMRVIDKRLQYVEEQVDSIDEKLQGDL